MDPGDEVELEELIDSEITLDSWIDPRDGRLKQLGLRLDSTDVCESAALDELEPYAADYEGYMGSWSNTLNRCYHRGAVVIWPRALSFAIHAEADPEPALGELIAMAREGDAAGAREAAATLEPFWHAVAANVGTKRFLGKALRAARLIDDEQTAAMLLAPFRLELLARSHATALAALAGCYGEAWLEALVSVWSAQRRYDYGGKPVTREAWVAGLAGLCEALAAAGPPGPLAGRILVADSWDWVRDHIDSGCALPRPSMRDDALHALGAPLAAIIQAAALIDAAAVGTQARDHLCGDDALVGCAVMTLSAAAASGWTASVLKQIADRAAAALRSRLARPSRAPGDWSISLSDGGCGCHLCATLRAFLADPQHTALEWPLAQNGREHTHHRIGTAELPLTHQTRRSRRPYTLILTKTETLFKDEAQQRHRDEQNLAWILSSWRPESTVSGRGG